ncbi:MAG: ferric reductase-like transmembrane domain-containing protein [Solirubrobacterales bacterium]
MGQQDFASHAWWLASRASGLVALGLVTASVALGLMMAGHLSRKPGANRVLSAIHEQTAVTGLVMIAVHGLTLLGDPWLNPGPSGIVLPFTMDYRPLWTGLGIIAGWSAAVLGLSFYFRKRIGPRLWRKAHRATIVVYALGVAHTLGAGTDATSPWLFWPVVASAAGIGALFVARVGSSMRRKRDKQPRSPRDREADAAQHRRRRQIPRVALKGQA